MSLFMCHDYGTQRPGRRLRDRQPPLSAIRTQVRDGVTADEFVAMREARDRTPGVPALILPALQVNMKAGQLPPEDANGRRSLRVLLNAIRQQPEVLPSFEVSRHLIELN